jgi:hypothetical protein
MKVEKERISTDGWYKYLSRTKDGGKEQQQRRYYPKRR